MGALPWHGMENVCLMKDVTRWWHACSPQRAVPLPQGSAAHLAVEVVGVDELEHVSHHARATGRHAVDGVAVALRGSTHMHACSVM